MSENEKSFGGWIWKVIVILGGIIAIPAGIAEFTGASLSNYFPNIFSDNTPDCVVPNITNISEAAAIIELKNLGLTPVKKSVFNKDYKVGIVISQYPLAERIMPKCKGQVMLEVSSSFQEDNRVEEIPTARNIDEAGKQERGISFFGLISILFVLYFIYKIFDYFF